MVLFDKGKMIVSGKTEVMIKGSVKGSRKVRFMRELWKLGSLNEELYIFKGNVRMGVWACLKWCII